MEMLLNDGRKAVGEQHLSTGLRTESWLTVTEEGCYIPSNWSLPKLWKRTVQLKDEGAIGLASGSGSGVHPRPVGQVLGFFVYD